MTDRPDHFYYVPILDNGAGSCRTDYLLAFLEAFGERRIHASRHGDSHPGRARNRAAAAFLESGCTHLLFIDTDILFRKQHIDWLYEGEEDILCGMYFLKQKEIRPCMTTLPDHKPCEAGFGGGTIKIARAGTGFMRIHRRVFEKLIEDGLAPRYVNGSRPEWDFFQSGVKPDPQGNPEWLSEDWYFCDNARQVGFDVSMDTRIQVKHQGTINYPIVDDAARLAVCPEDLRPHMEQIWKGEYAIPNMPEPKTILDIGANIGGFACWAAETWPKARLTCYEPHPDNVTLLQWNTRHMVGRLRIKQEAVRDRDGLFHLVPGSNSGEHSFHYDGLGGIDVRAISAADLSPADFVKLDCEGCEPEIIRTYDWTGTQAVALEYHSEQDREEIPKLLEERGFEMVKHHPTHALRGIMKFLRKK